MGGHQSSGARAPELWCPLCNWLFNTKKGVPPTPTSATYGQQFLFVQNMSVVINEHRIYLDDNQSNSDEYDINLGRWALKSRIHV